MSIKLSSVDRSDTPKQSLLANEVFPNRVKNFHPDRNFSHPLEMSGEVRAAQDMTASLSYITRVFFGSLPTGIPLSGPHPYQVFFGSTSGFGVMHGLFDARLAEFRKERATLVGNTEAEKNHETDQLRAKLSAGSGICFLVHKVIKAAVILRVIPILSQIMSGMEILGTGLLLWSGSMTCGRVLDQGIEAERLIKDVLNVAHPFEYLLDQMYPTQETIRYHKDKESLLKEALLNGRELLKSLFQSVNRAELKDEEYDALLLGIFGKERLQLEAYAFRNRQKLEAVCGKEVVAKIKPGLGVEEKKAVVNEMKERADQKLSKTGKVASLIIVTLCLFAISFFIANPIAGLVIAALLVALELPNMYWAGQAMLQQGALLPNDRLFLKGGIAVGILSLVATIGLTVAFPFALAPLILGGVMTAGWLGTHALVLMKTREVTPIQVAPLTAQERQKVQQTISYYVQKHLKCRNGRYDCRFPRIPRYREGA